MSNSATPVTLNKSDALKLIKDSLKKSNVLITGPSGVGKTHYANELRSALNDPSVTFVKLDKYGKRLGTKFPIKDFPIFTKGVVYEGAFTALKEGGQADRLVLDLVIILVPDQKGFSVMQALKAKEGVAKGLPQSWIDHRNRQSLMSTKEYKVLMNEKASAIIKSFPATRSVFVINKISGKVTEGWAK